MIHLTLSTSNLDDDATFFVVETNQDGLKHQFLGRHS